MLANMQAHVRGRQMEPVRADVPLGCWENGWGRCDEAGGWLISRRKKMNLVDFIKEFHQALISA